MANPPRVVDPRQLRKRMLMFFFAAGVNLLMAFWVATVGSSQAGGASLMVVMLVFLGFAAVNYYMARRIQKFLKQLPLSMPPAQSGTTEKD
jgi:MFS-type transporter involved in bile tolerance (Atg22 family)